MSSRSKRGRRAVLGAGAILLGLGSIGYSAGCGLSTEGTLTDVAGAPCNTAADCDDMNRCTDDECTDQKICANAKQTGGGPDDANPCTVDECADGVETHTPAAEGTTCQNGASTGVCTMAKCVVQCASDATCDDANSCTTDSCDSGSKTCLHGLLNGPEPGITPIKGDCRQALCVAGVASTVNDDTDVPAPVDCVAATCSAGTLTVTKLPAEAPCGAGGTLKCDGGGTCVNCVGDADCTVSSPCQIPACAAGKCVPKNVASGTLLPGQTKGDCQKLVCDGSGKQASQADDTDAPADDGNACTVEACLKGAPVHDPAPNLDAACPGGFCDPAGKCVQCNEDKECDDGDACTTDTCANATCAHAALLCTDGNACTSDSCDPKMGCVFANLVDGTPCGAAASCSTNAFTSADACAKGICVPGTTTKCDDGNPCTTDACSTPGGCTHADAGDGTPCGPASCAGDMFTAGATCLNETCVPGKTTNCNLLNPCTTDSCSPTSGCSSVSMPADTTCGSPSCPDFLHSLAAPTCDASMISQCVSVSPVACGGAYRCSGLGVCGTCSDGSTNGAETDVDCGGGSPCDGCGPGQKCNVDTDCAAPLGCAAGGGSAQKICG